MTDGAGTALSIEGFLVQGNIGSGVTDANGKKNGNWVAWTFSTPVVVPIPAAAWLFGSALGLVGFMRREAATN